MERIRVVRSLGWDPGIKHTGFGILERDGSKFKHIAHGHIDNVYKMGDHRCLPYIFDVAKEILLQHKPDIVSVETVYFQRNQTTAMATAEVIGILSIMPRALGINAMTLRFPPHVVKAAVGLDIKSNKKQVEANIRRLLRLDKEIKPHHAADGLVIALCGLLQPLYQERGVVHKPVSRSSRRKARTPKSKI